MVNQKYPEECQKAILAFNLDLERFLATLSKYNSNKNLTDNQKRLICLCLAGYFPRDIARENYARRFEKEFKALTSEQRNNFLERIINKYQQKLEKHKQKIKDKLKEKEELEKDASSSKKIKAVEQKLKQVISIINRHNFEIRKLENLIRNCTTSEEEQLKIYVSEKIDTAAKRVNEELNKTGVNDLIKTFIMENKVNEANLEEEHRIPWMKLVIWLRENGWQKNIKTTRQTQKIKLISNNQKIPLEKIVDLLVKVNKECGKGSLSISKNTLESLLHDLQIETN